MYVLDLRSQGTARSTEEKNERLAIHERVARLEGQVVKDQPADLDIYKMKATLPAHNKWRKGNLAVDHETTKQLVEIELVKGKMRCDARAAEQQPALGEMMAIFQLLK